MGSFRELAQELVALTNGYGQSQRDILASVEETLEREYRHAMLMVERAKLAEMRAARVAVYEQNPKLPTVWETKHSQAADRLTAEALGEAE